MAKGGAELAAHKQEQGYHAGLAKKISTKQTLQPTQHSPAHATMPGLSKLPPCAHRMLRAGGMAARLGLAAMAGDAATRTCNECGHVDSSRMEHGRQMNITIGQASLQTPASGARLLRWGNGGRKTVRTGQHAVAFWGPQGAGAACSGSSPRCSAPSGSRGKQHASRARHTCIERPSATRKCKLTAPPTHLHHQPQTSASAGSRGIEGQTRPNHSRQACRKDQLMDCVALPASKFGKAEGHVAWAPGGSGLGH